MLCNLNTQLLNLQNPCDEMWLQKQVHTAFIVKNTAACAYQWHKAEV